MVPEKIRVSIGTAAVLGLLDYKVQVPPTTAYLMSYSKDGCIANCVFCSQSRVNKGNKEQLSRVVWPVFILDKVLKGLEKPSIEVLERICLQVINYPGFIEDIIELVKILSEIKLPVSVDTCPVSSDSLKKLKEAGAERISIPLDGATETIFDKIKGKSVNGPYRWSKHIKALDQAVEIFGEGKVGTNLIVGLGETEKEAADLITRMHEKHINTILFAFTPLQGTILQHKKQPSLESYRRVQAARYLLINNLVTMGDLSFNEAGEITGYGKTDLATALEDGKAFQTTGCPGCNRPFYNERPSGPFYNYPRPLSPDEVIREKGKLGVN